MAQKKYVSLNKLSTFLDNLKTMFASLTHTHELSDIADYAIDDEFSSTSTNPVQNKIIDAEFEAVSTAMNALESAIDAKADSEHNHIVSDINDLTVTATELNFVSGITSNIQNQFNSLVTVFIGTQSQYEMAYSNGIIPVNTLVIITKEEMSNNASTSSVLNTGILGHLILGQ